MFIDASALCAILADETDGPSLRRRIELGERRVTSPTALWETTVAVCRKLDVSPQDAAASVFAVVAKLDIPVASIPPEVAHLAIDAFARFGKGRHPAGLNFGDCFAYACARYFGLPLLFKGGDFARTDIAAA